MSDIYELTPEQEEIIKERLRAIGYLKEKCVLCSKEMNYNPMTYVDGVGQLCNKCHLKTYEK